MANQDRRMVPYGIDLNSIPKLSSQLAMLSLSLPFHQSLAAMANPILLSQFSQHLRSPSC
jgi:hypothetical protein